MRNHGTVPNVLEDSFVLLCYTMSKSTIIRRKFRSELFERDINTIEKDYLAIICSELLYRIDKISQENCDCYNCRDELVRYKSSLPKIKSMLAEPKYTDSKVVV